MEAEEMEDHLATMIAKARWIYHCQRCKIGNRQKKRMNIETVIQKLDRRMKVVADLSKKKTAKVDQANKKKEKSTQA